MKTVLFIDEEYWFVEPIINKVRKELSGIELLYCEDGIEAIHLIKENSEIAFAIVDLQLPLFDADLLKEFSESLKYPRNLTGFMVMEKLKNLRPEIKVLVLTIVADLEVQLLIEKYGAKYVSKNSPSVIVEILSWIRVGL
jgi:CheY-like chemotaxis protein